MVSVENFYWVLWQCLLAPSNVNCFYYYPWGTQHNLSQWEFLPEWRHPPDVNHVLFHFDQEPIRTSSLGKIYDSQRMAWGFSKWVKILANSERSQLKQELCKQRHMLDWYYFYHGFAALDWYQDGQYVDVQSDITTAYLSFNQLVKGPRSYRMSLLARLIDLDSTANGKISFHGHQQDIVAELQDPHTNLSCNSKDIIADTLSHIDSFPWTCDRVAISGDLSARFGAHELALWQSSFVHLVNETVFYEPKLHLTEKVFKPIVAQRPFILVSSPGALAYLREYGFLTFESWIDESYDTIQDHDTRLDAIAQEVARLHALPMSHLRCLLEEMQTILAHNKRHFYREFKSIIVEELVDNFDTCLCVWNNGRVDDRGLARHPDLASVKRRLSI